LIRLLDILFSTLGIIILLPLFIIICLIIKADSKGGCFYIQERIGKDGKPFGILKFRTMRSGADADGLLTIGTQDKRITRVGNILRKTKIDELPQLWNVLKGEMSIVGPRPEVEKYVLLYTEEQRKVLSVRPGITDYASIEYVNENEILSQTSNPDRAYIEEIMPHKIKLSMRYLEHYTVSEYFKIIFLTLKKVIS
jgi:lipopolysaccharide/colanic/teichoic acid biosynthesis glycosyltransferase